MESRELRIGNYVNWIIPFSNEYSPKEVDIKILSLINNDSDICKPIPLTEEWLLKFGFSKFLNQYTLITSVHKKDFKNIPFIVLYLDNKFEYDDLRFRTNLKHVHQLQNLYFALTGEELTTQELNQ
jgi:hypothetical protein